jgi:hypothetical protein
LAAALRRTGRSLVDKPQTSQDRVVLCMKWGTKYGPEYVNRLHAMVARALSQPFRFVCLTDDRSGIAAGVDCYDIPAVPLPGDGKERGWKKIAAFAPELSGHLGATALFLDLDVVVVGALDVFFEQPGDFVIIRDWYHPFVTIGNSSVFRFRPSLGSGVFNYFCSNGAAIARKHRNEQEYLTQFMRDHGHLAFWPKAWCRSFRLSCVPLWPRSLWQPPTIPDDSRIIVFHGDPKPPTAILGKRGLFLGMRPAPWVAQHWRD